MKQARHATKRARRYLIVTRACGMTLLAGGGWSFYLAASAPRALASTLGGTATISDPATNEQLASGSSTSNFTVELPANAACSGDTQNDGYLVYSYLVKQGTDVTTITFAKNPSVGYGFVDNTGKYYGAANTAPTTGQIVDIPNNFEWAPLSTVDGVALSTILYSGNSGVWEAGIACADKSGALTDYWNTEVTFTQSSSDPNGFTWSAVPGVPNSTSTTTTSSTSSTTTSSTSSTTTSTTSSTTSTTSTTSASTTSTTDDAASSTDGSGTGTSDSSDQSSGGQAGAADGTTASASTLPLTGAPVVRYLALGLLFLGLGSILLGLSTRRVLFEALLGETSNR